MAASLKIEELPFTKEDIAIDHFTLPLEAFANDGFHTYSYGYLEGNDSPSNKLGEFVTKEHLAGYAGVGDRQTVVYDIQVGKGKTSSFYNMILDLYKDESNIILVLSPFKKLVEKDYETLHREKKIDAFCYLDFNKRTDTDNEIILENALKKKVHVMSINCLLRNPGTEVFEQFAEKSKYLDRLISKCEKEGKKVHMFFDEIHESIYNFKSSFVPYLMRWESVVKNCYVSTATYTVASFPVIKYIAALTDDNIVYVYYPREKWTDKVSKIHLHIIDDPYSGQDLEPLSHLKTILEENLDKQVNIITGTKAIATGLLAKNKTNGTENPFFNTVSKFNFNEVTGSNSRSDKRFGPNSNNIGTVIKTGINIENPDSLLIIILPAIVDTFSDKGIFSDGLPSMIQATARLRNGGTIHIFMYQPKYLIEPDNTVHTIIEPGGNTLPGYWAFDTYTPLKNRLPEHFTQNKTELKYINQYEAMNKLLLQYVRERKKLKAELTMLNNKQEKQAVRLGFHYPSFEQFIMDGGGQILVNEYIQFGGDLSSLMLWACMNGQFVNGDLERIYWHTRHVTKVVLEPGMYKETLLKYLPSKALNHIKDLELGKAYHYLLGKIKVGKSPDEIDNANAPDCIRQFSIVDKEISTAKLTTTPEFMQAIVMIYADARGLQVNKNNLKECYISDSIAAACKMVDDNILVKAYQQLRFIRQDFLDFCRTQIVKTNKGQKVIHEDAYLNMPISIVEDVQDIMGFLEKEDLLIKNNAISIWQKIVDKDPNDCLQPVYKELRSLFTNIATPKMMVGKLRVYNPVIGLLEKELPAEPVLYML